MKKNILTFRQGDVGFEKISALPKNLKEVKNKVLAFGEATGHQHKLVDEKVKVFEDPKGILFIYFPSDGLLYHGTNEQIKNQIEAPEKIDYIKEDIHKPLPVKKGAYKIIIEKGFDPYKKLERRVRD